MVWDPLNYTLCSSSANAFASLFNLKRRRCEHFCVHTNTLTRIKICTHNVIWNNRRTQSRMKCSVSSPASSSSDISSSLSPRCTTGKGEWRVSVCGRLCKQWDIKTKHTGGLCVRMWSPQLNPFTCTCKWTRVVFPSLSETWNLKKKKKKEDHF